MTPKVKIHPKPGLKVLWIIQSRRKPNPMAIQAFWRIW
jgi:hypothetical protein